MAKGRKSKRPETVAKTATVQVRVSPEERDAWQAAADADHRTVSDWLRLLASEAIKQRAAR